MTSQRQRRDIHVLECWFLVITDQLMDIIWGLWMILYLDGWKIVLSFDNPSVLG